jgi:hypothetical protein
MIVYYALGAGLGHLTRARAVLHTLNIEKQATILTNSPFASNSQVLGDIPVRAVKANVCAGIRPGSQDIADAAIRTLQAMQPDELILDAFPCGLYGEINADVKARQLQNTKITYVARLLRWDSYMEVMPDAPGSVEKTLVLEPLLPQHDHFVRTISTRVENMNHLSYPEHAPTDQLVESIEIASGGQPFWLVAHSGPSHEVLELIAYAVEMRQLEQAQVCLVVAGNVRLVEPLPEFVRFLPAFTFPLDYVVYRAERVVTACGFNSMRQLEPISHKHRYMPFDRRYDDQYTRATRRLDRSATWDDLSD